MRLVSKYHIGTSKHWPGSSVFWQVDERGSIRTGKIMQYSPVTGKRVKEPHNLIAWAHTALKLPEFNLQTCLYGLHLLMGDRIKPVAIVESEKTAILCSVFLPQFIWLATGGLSCLSPEKCRVLQGRKVTLWPDVNAFLKWEVKARELGFGISDLLEKRATDKQRAGGWDLADFLVNRDSSGLAITDHGYPVSWDF
jgi:hypothetical protein